MDQILQILTMSPSQWSSSETEEFRLNLQRFSFFQELETVDDSGDLTRECIKCFEIMRLTEDECLLPGIYIILKGSLNIQHADVSVLPKQFRKNTLTNIKNVSSPDVVTLGPGVLFGEMEKNDPYSVTCNSQCVLAMFSQRKYSKILEKHEEITNEKIEFLKSLDIFKHWSRLSVRKVVNVFEKKKYRKGNVIYRENDPANEIFIVASGEFKLTQKFLVGSDENSMENYEFGVNIGLKQNVLKSDIRSRDLQVVIKQKCDIFGYNEVFQNKVPREFTCTCMTQSGELFIITEKEFAKRLSHPETIRVLEEQGRIFQKWTKSRLQSLKFLESYKTKLSYTPKNKIKKSVKRLITPISTVFIKRNYTPSPVLPAILSKMMSTRQQNTFSRRKPESSFLLFPTELPTEKSSKSFRIDKHLI